VLAAIFAGESEGRPVIQAASEEGRA